MSERARGGEPGLILSHGVDGPPALLGEWLEERGVGHEVVDISVAGVPELGERPFVASLGAEESVRGDGGPGWVAEEIALLRAAVAADVPVLGLCFGGQALSIALGGEVGPAAPPQVGWFELSVREHGMVAPGPWFHWHYDQLSVPPGGLELARSPAGPAAFRHGRHLGLQFHPEVTLAVIAAWSRSERALARHGISAAQLAAESEARAPAARREAWRLFERWWEGLARG